MKWSVHKFDRFAIRILKKRSNLLSILIDSMHNRLQTFGERELLTEHKWKECKGSARDTSWMHQAGSQTSIVYLFNIL